jgi:hypothetical protein
MNVFMMNQELFRLQTIAYKAGESFRNARQVYVELARLPDNGCSRASYRRYENAFEAAATYQRALYNLWSKLNSMQSFPGKEERLERTFALVEALFRWCNATAKQFNEW